MCLSVYVLMCSSMCMCAICLFLPASSPERRAVLTIPWRRCRKTWRISSPSTGTPSSTASACPWACPSGRPSIAYSRYYCFCKHVCNVCVGLATFTYKQCGIFLCQICKMLSTTINFSSPVTANSLARAVTATPKTEHITPVLKYVHWLKIEEHIHYKIISYT